jgi:hypothetical protein
MSGSVSVLVTREVRRSSGVVQLRGDAAMGWGSIEFGVD